jgi:two-component system nitrate/nitrite response regulator NarL
MSKTRPFDIVIADKSPIVQNGLRALLDEDPRFDVIAVASDGERFLEAVDRLAFDIGIIGWEMPYLNGHAVLDALKTHDNPPRIIVYTGSQDTRVPDEAMAAGAAGFCHKSDPPERLVETVAAVAAGRMVFPFGVGARTAAESPQTRLTEREKDLLAALASGRTNAQLAKDLDISVNTVKFHLKNLYEKLQVANRAQAVAKFMNGV